MDLLSEEVVLSFRIAVEIHPVEIFTVEVVSEHALENPLGVQHGYKGEMEMFPQQVRTVVFLVQQEAEHALHAEGCGRLTRMHTCRNDDPWLVYLEGPLCALLKNALHCGLPLSSYIPPISDCHQMHPPCLTGPTKRLLMEVYLRVAAVLPTHSMYEIIAILV